MNLNSENLPIVFYFPYKRGAGGVNVLFLRLSDYLADNSDHDIFIADYQDGYMATHNTNKRVRELYLKPDEPLLLPEDAVVILQTIPPWHLPKELEFPSNTKLLFWNLHPYNLLWDFSIDRSKKSHSYRIKTWYSRHLVKKFVSTTLRKNGIVFMDGENLLNTEKITDRRIRNPIFLPVCTNEPNKHPQFFSNQFAWLGRLADFKISILNHTIEKLAEYALRKNFEIDFFVIGDGPDRNKVEEQAKSSDNEYFKVIFMGEIDIVNLDKFLISNVNVLFAMGTAGLDGARLGIPVVLLDFSYEPLKGDYVYKFLYETENYTLGRDIGDWAYKPGNTSLETIVDGLRTEYEKHSNECYNYVVQNHGIDVVAKKLLESVDNCKMNYRSLKKYQQGLRPYLRDWSSNKLRYPWGLGSYSSHLRNWIRNSI